MKLDYSSNLRIFTKYDPRFLEVGFHKILTLYFLYCKSNYKYRSIELYRNQIPTVFNNSSSHNHFINRLRELLLLKIKINGKQLGEPECITHSTDISSAYSIRPLVSIICLQTHLILILTRSIPARTLEISFDTND